MKKISLILIGLVAILVSLASPVTAMAAPPMSISPLPEKTMAQPIVEQLGQQLQSLVAPLGTAALQPPAESDEVTQEPTPTFGTRALNVVINVMEILRTQAQRVVTNFSALPQLSDWYAQQSSEPRRTYWIEAGNEIVTTAGIALLIALVLELALYPAYRGLRKQMPRSFSGRLAIVLSLFILRGLPIIVFITGSVLLLNQHEPHKLSRFLVTNIVYALALMRVVISLLRGVFAPTVESLRFLPATTEQAVYGYRWLRAFSILIIFGYFVMSVAHSTRVPDLAITAFADMLGFVLMTMGIIVIMQKRSFVAQLLRGNLSAAQPDLSWFESLRLWFARHWGTLAIAYLIIGYFIAVMGVQDGLVLMLRGTLLTLFILIGTRLLFREISMWEIGARKESATFYPLIKGAVLRVLVISAAIVGGCAAWGANLSAFASTTLGNRLMGAAFSVGVTFFILGLIYEFFSSAIDRYLTPRKSGDRVIEITARSRTLLPMIRNILFVIFLMVIAFVVLSEAGVNVAPLIAGAGVVGVAVGFGSQALVKDFLTGLFIVLENTIAVGDVVKIGDHSGVVEAMSMRTLRLRDNDGSLHIVPFSETSQIINHTKGFSFAAIKVNIATEANIDKAFESIRAVAEALRADPAYQYSILEPVEIQGVDSINETSITIVARMRTRPGRQWDVRRKFLWMLKQRFDADGVPLPSSTTVRLLKD